MVSSCSFLQGFLEEKKSKSNFDIKHENVFQFKKNTQQLKTTALRVQIKKKRKGTIICIMITIPLFLLN